MTSSSSSWSLESFCAAQGGDEDWSTLPDSSRDFLQAVGLPSMHPFCINFTNNNSNNRSNDDYYLKGAIPRQGPMLLLDDQHHHQHLNSFWEAIVTILYMVVPSMACMAELWLRFFAFVIAPLSIAMLLQDEFSMPAVIVKDQQEKKKKNYSRTPMMTMAAIASITSSMILLTDTLYVMEFGPKLGASLLVVSCILSRRAATRHGFSKAVVAILLGLVMLTVYLVVDVKKQPPTLVFGHAQEWVNDTALPEGLYYSANNAFIHQLVSRHWNEVDRSYNFLTSSDGSSASSTAVGATPWMPTGDSRTGLPFLLCRVASPTWHRIWLPDPSDARGNGRSKRYDDEDATLVHEEVVALDVAFPDTGHDPTQPVYLLLHGLNGGSQEEYVKDFAWRRTSSVENATVVVMIARGLMDLPVRGWNVFHGARWSDAHHASLALRRGMANGQVLAGVGYSMGAIILSNMVTRTGRDCALDAAVAISGGMDMRIQGQYSRAQRVFQPILTRELREAFLLGKWGERMRRRLTGEQMLATMRATHITEIDEHAIVNYHGFDDLNHYYTEMSALGDVPLEELYDADSLAPSRRIHQIAIPFCVVQALDDPLITWRTVASNSGVLHPSNLTKTGSGHLLLLLTKRGGHVGWPLGMFPWQHKWKWMNNVASTFVQAVQQAKAST
jgi:predicted alpha/beta-fold hydrolase